MAGSTADLEATVGEVFPIALEGVPTSGFRWEADVVPDVLELVSQDVQVTSGPIGGSAQEVFRFRAQGARGDAIHFVQWRPWESAPPVDERRSGSTIRA